MEIPRLNPPLIDLDLAEKRCYVRVSLLKVPEKRYSETSFRQKTSCHSKSRPNIAAPNAERGSQDHPYNWIRCQELTEVYKAMKLEKRSLVLRQIAELTLPNPVFDDEKTLKDRHWSVSLSRADAKIGAKIYSHFRFERL